MLDASEMITFTEKLIEEIKHFPVLYDRKVMRAKDKLEKEEAWISLTDRIPTDLRIKVDDTKKRWRTLKDCYSKYLRSFKTSNRFEARYQSWRWSEHMDFFKPFMLHNDSSDEYQSTFQKRVKKRKYDRRINDFQPHIINNNFKSRTNIDSHDEYIKNAQVNTTHGPSSKIKGEIDEVDDETYQAIASAVSDYENTSGGWDELMNEPDNEDIIHNSSSKSIASIDPGNYLDPLGGRNFDGLDLTFLGYASSIKKLTARRQSLIKFAVAKLIMREELAQQNDNEKNCPHKARFNI
ncbi:uncharacterized protein LOC105208369 [Zeugodacus cucurbitae]|uniref:Transcription factor Adf-1 n=1 Tax=Zeugodacus cucurbitae TaxID=28588 RepID=A0A0A1XJ45_ZEUCU|nr:uncharacterized protein LOC105208369 [Zeugodacus cucurbitae]